MAGMAPDIWGPMAWRLLHGAAHRFDTRETEDPVDGVVFLLFLLQIAWVLPCLYCRHSYTTYILDAQSRFDEYCQQRNVQAFVIELHNQVNQKLDKPVFDRLDLVRRRACVWGVNPEDLFGLLFVIVLNYNSNREPEKETHYQNFFALLPDLFTVLGYDRLAMAFDSMATLASGPLTEETLAQALYHTKRVWSMMDPPPELSLDETIARYGLCRSQKK